MVEKLKTIIKCVWFRLRIRLHAQFFSATVHWSGNDEDNWTHGPQGAWPVVSAKVPVTVERLRNNTQRKLYCADTTFWRRYWRFESSGKWTCVQGLDCFCPKVNVTIFPFQTLGTNRPKTQHHILTEPTVWVLLLSVQEQKSHSCSLSLQTLEYSTRNICEHVCQQ
jgi:hypothetical protein